MLLGRLLLVGLALAGASAQAKCRLDAPGVAAAGAGCAAAWMDRNLRLNDLFAVGTHNSYKQPVPPAEYRLTAATDPDGARARDYGHKPLTAQLDAGARGLEIDVVRDPAGGRFADPLIARAAGDRLDPRWRRAMMRPGLKVMHVPDVDFRSSCATFRDCLRTLRRWSDAHPRHVPILILVNAKDGAATPGGVPLLPFDTAAFDAFDREVRAVLPPGRLVTPDMVQGRYPTLRDAVLAGNWPRLGAARGRFLFALDEGPEKVAAYRAGRRSLEGRVMFVNIDETSPAAAYRTLNDAAKDGDRIAADVRAGFLVRTRADADTSQARRDDTTYRDATLRSGAQIVSTDYLWPDPRFAGGFAVRLPGGAAALCNPLRTGTRCAGRAVEEVEAADRQRADGVPLDYPAR